jgi:hypothetical protein
MYKILTEGCMQTNKMSGTVGKVELAYDNYRAFVIIAPSLPDS